MINRCATCHSDFEPSAGTSVSGKLFHIPCMKCNRCRKELVQGDPQVRCFEDELYCYACFKKTISGVPITKGTRKIDPMNQIDDICPVCNKKAYFAESVQKYHKLCFKCTTCNKILESSTACDNDKKLYCKACHGKNFGPKGYGYGVGAGALTNTK